MNKKKYQAKVGPRPTKVIYDADGEVRLRAFWPIWGTATAEVAVPSSY